MFEDSPGVRSSAAAATVPLTRRPKSRGEIALAVSRGLFVALTAALFIVWAAHSG